MKNIIDISKWQGSMDWDRMVANRSNPDLRIDAVLFKATQGAYWIDPLFEENRRESIAHGFPFGVFHFLSDYGVM